jgi:hypothetical protein
MKKSSFKINLTPFPSPKERGEVIFRTLSGHSQIQDSTLALDVES